ncbi:MAG: ADP-ribosylation/Crystallin [Planctomycetaceae bacterium]|nr:ADP-ribosylation/Crystallin [Planctomycetaceae bacterium]
MLRAGFRGASFDQWMLVMTDESPTRSRELLDELFERELISIRRGSIYDACPAPLDLSELRRNDRIEGLLLGVAAGDSLGHSTEWQYDAEMRNKQFGTILDHVSSTTSTPGRISDDTQLTFWTVERLLARGNFDFDDLAQCFSERRHKIVGMGKNTSAALRRHADRITHGSPARHVCAGDPLLDGRGNGSLMRFGPVVLPHLKRPSTDLWADATLSALITHGNVCSLSATIAFTHLLWEILRRPLGSAPDPEWWLDEYVKIARELETAPLPLPLNTDPIPGEFRDFHGTLWQFVDNNVRRAWRRGVSVRDACSLKWFGSRADILQTVPSVLYILMSHADSFESAIIAAVNDTKDNDTIAAIAGAIVGALHGRKRVRQKWIDGIRSRSLGIEGLEHLDDREVVERVARHAARRFAGSKAGGSFFAEED